MSKSKNVIDFYVLTNKLKNVIRTGWKDWNVEKQRLESVAEHIFGVQMLAISIYSEYSYDIDIKKVISMLALHELEEIYIGDLTMFQISKDEKRKIGKEAVSKVVANLASKEEIISIIDEFEARETKEAKFAYFCDKLECDIQAKLYDLEGCVNIKNQDNNLTFNDPRVQKLLKDDNSFSKMWLLFGQSQYNYDENFLEISNYVINHDIKKGD